MPSIYPANDPGVYELSMGRWSRRLGRSLPRLRCDRPRRQGHRRRLRHGQPDLARSRMLAPGAEIVGMDYSQAYVDHAGSKGSGYEGG